MACHLIMGPPLNTHNPMMKECVIETCVTANCDLECFSSSNKETTKQRHREIHTNSQSVFGAPYEMMQVSMSFSEEKGDLALQSPVHSSQSKEPCEFLQSPKMAAFNFLQRPLSKTSPRDSGHPLPKNLTLIDPLPKLGFEKKSVPLSNMQGAESSPYSWKHAFDKEQSTQQSFCKMEICASPFLNVQPKDHSQRSYLSPVTHTELELKNFENNIPVSIDELSPSIFMPNVIESCEGAIMDANALLQVPKDETLKDSKVIILSTDKKWPFLLRFPICFFGMNLGLGSQAILWKTLASQGHIWSMQVPALINLVLWCVAAISLIIVFTIYAVKVVFYFEAVRQEFNHPIRVNFFFAPWAACILLALGAPPSIAYYIHSNIWILFMVPILGLNLKVYGDWLSGRERNLCRVANPCTHLSLMGNFMGAFLLGTFGYMELALFFWSIGFVHYLVLLVTLYQRLPSALVLPKELHPIFFLFVALPCSASVAWAKIMGEFDSVARMIYFVAMFILLSLVIRFKLFFGLRFNIAWWAYTFPLTVSAIATLQYSFQVKHFLTQFMAAILILASSSVVFSLAITTILHTFVWKSMFPNDVVIVLAKKQKNPHKRSEETRELIIPAAEVHKQCMCG